MPILNYFLCFRPVWKWNEEGGAGKIPAKIQNFALIEGNNAMNVVNPVILKNLSPIAKLAGHKVEIFQKDNFIICIAEEKDLNYFATITELLEPWIQAAENCTIVSLQSISEYKIDEVPESCIIRSINGFADVPPLEVPNFITGVSAGVGTMRKLKDLPFSCFIVYVDIYDVFTIKTVVNLLKRLQLPVDDTVAIKPLHQKSDLYM